MSILGPRDIADAMPYRLSSIYYPNGNPDLEDNVLQMVQHWHRWVFATVETELGTRLVGYMHLSQDDGAHAASESARRGLPPKGVLDDVAFLTLQESRSR